MTIKEMRLLLNESQASFAARYGIPKRSVENWESGSRIPPDYVVRLLERCVLEDAEAQKCSEQTSEISR